MVPNHGKKGNYYENSRLSHCQMNFTSKENGGKKNFLNETKASMSFIPTRRTSLWCPIMNRKEIVMWIDVYPN